MKYSLMHKDVKACSFVIDEYGSIIGNVMIADPAHMPLGTMIDDSTVDPICFRNWWIGRTIPPSRSGVRDFFEALGICNCAPLLKHSLALSLSDHYWIKSVGSDTHYSDLNFFKIDFSEDIGNLLFEKHRSDKEFDYMSPDITTIGNLKKRWKIINGHRYLLKGGSGLFQQPLNEVIASRVMDVLNISHVDYEIIWDDGYPYSICKDFVTTSTEFISAFHVMNSMKNTSNTSVYNHYVNCCQKHGLDVIPDLDRMITVDYILANNDRHTNNFGIIRNPDSLEWYTSAPIFDTGNSLGVGIPPSDIRTKIGRECKPFAKTFEEEMRLVTDLSWIDVDALDSLKPEIDSILKTSKSITDEHRNAILEIYSDRVDSVRRRL